MLRSLITAALAGMLLVSSAAAARATEIDGEDAVHGGFYSSEFFASDFDGHAAATGTRVTFGGTFHNPFENDGARGTWSNTREILNEVWLGKATPFANLGIDDSAARIASGVYDAKIGEWASHVEQYLDLGGGRSLILALFPEANYGPTPYGCDPVDFKVAFQKVVSIFRARGIDETQVRWAFAPNNWTSPGCGSIADYYPGSSYVDILSFSGYNFGSCVGTGWESVESTVSSAIADLTAIDPTKPIVAAQTAAARNCGGDQSQWVRDLYSHLAGEPNVVGLVWFNIDKEALWKIWTGSWVAPGWKDAVNAPTTSYQWPLTDWFQPGPLTVAPPTPLIPPCPDAATCDSVVGIDPGGQWHLRHAIAPSEPVQQFFFGNPGDVAFVGDWDCDGVATPGLYRRSDGFVYLRNSNSQGIADVEFFFGNPGDLPLIGDWNNDGCDTVSIYRPAQGRIFVVNELGISGGGLGAADYDFFFGNVGDAPFVGDFDGDGVDTVGLYRQSTGFVYFRNSLATGIADLAFFYGDPGDVIMAGDWDGDGVDTVAVYRPSTSNVYLNFANAPGTADFTMFLGGFTQTAAGGF